LRALNIFAVKKKFLSRGVEALSILPNLVDLSKNWRGMHGGKKQDFFFGSQAEKSPLALSGPVASTW
jgi:hypothetical protein